MPNSNEEHDIDIKNQVVIVVKDFLEENFNEDKEIFIDSIESNLDNLEEKIKQIESNVSVSFDDHNFYNKSYNDSALKNANHLTLLIKLDEAKGSNWWASVYPNFLDISGSEEVVYESLIEKLINKIRG